MAAVKQWMLSMYHAIHKPLVHSLLAHCTHHCDVELVRTCAGLAAAFLFPLYLHNTCVHIHIFALTDAGLISKRESQTNNILYASY